jgi:tripartite-type tricarboxylate transporter receptor subunit TctC
VLTVPAMAGMAPAACPGPSAAWPRRAIRVISPFAPGSGTDIVARLVSDRLSAELGVPVVVEPRPGAAGNIGSVSPRRRTATLLVLASFAIAPALYRNLGFDPVKDFDASPRRHRPCWCWCGPTRR